MPKLYCNIDEITHGQRILLNLMESRELSSFWHHYKDKYSLDYFFYVATGRWSPPSYTFVYEVREHINPILWFYKESEKVPNATFNQPIVFFSESINYLKLLNMDKSYLWYFFVTTNHSKSLYQSTIPIISGTRLINCNYIKRLDASFHEEFPIENWFIAP